MQLKNCPVCGKLFTCISRNLCPECIAREEETLGNIQSYIDEHKNATIPEISEGTGIPVERIVSLLQNGRLVTTRANQLLTCERCGAPISYGRFCAGCSTALKSSFQKAIPQRDLPGEREVSGERGVSGKNKTETRARMYVSDIYRKTSR